jgi:hypothetical protein
MQQGLLCLSNNFTFATMDKKNTKKGINEPAIKLQLTRNSHVKCRLKYQNLSEESEIAM